MPVSTNRSVIRRWLPTMIRGGAAFAALCALSAPHAAIAQTFVVDQQQTQTNGATLIFGNEPLGQEFVPTAATLNRIILNTQDFDLDDAMGAVLQVDVRLGSVGGTLLGTSSAVSLDNEFFGDTMFDFAAPVNLTTGSTHLFIVRQTSGGLWGVADFVADPPVPDAYPAGSAIVGGVPDPTRDLLFQTGMVTASSAIPEPPTLCLLLPMALIVPLCARFRRA